MNTYEEGFSLLELSVAAAIAVIITSVGLLTVPNLISDTETKTANYEACGLQRESEIEKLIDGQDPDIKSNCASANPTP